MALISQQDDFSTLEVNFGKRDTNVIVRVRHKNSVSEPQDFCFVATYQKKIFDLKNWKLKSKKSEKGLVSLRGMPTPNLTPTPTQHCAQTRLGIGVASAWTPKPVRWRWCQRYVRLNAQEALQTAPTLTKTDENIQGPWNVQLWIGVFTLYASNIKWFALQICVLSAPNCGVTANASALSPEAPMGP